MIISPPAEMAKIKQILIHTPIFDHVQARLHSCLDETGTTATPACVPIVGPSRTGKSFTTRDFEAKYPAVRVGEGLKKEVIYVQAPPSGTERGLMEAVLRALGDPRWMKGSRANLLDRLHTYLDGVGCKMIILDEFQHLVDKGQKLRLQNATDWLKALVERNTFSLVTVGLPSSIKIIHSNDQLRGRFDATIEMPAYNWLDENSRRNFRGTLAAFQENMAPFQTPDLASGDTALRFFIACGGRIGILARIFDRAVKDAIADSRREIRLADFDKAYQTAVWMSAYLKLPKGPFFAQLNDQSAQDVSQQFDALADGGPVDKIDSLLHMGGLQPQGQSAAATKKQHSRDMAIALG